ncbi:MAG TPA: DUF4062 domain-containing protein [Pyrinomonadaceae bacterium]|nr:DUF4062 domain-containing protein [Pyrinomonadaceae bacterium]
MRIFISSSFEDLREHRAAAIRVLSQLGHEVHPMEHMIAGSAAPLVKVIEMVDRSEAYVGLFAWRYGYVPTGATDPPTPAATIPPVVKGATFGKTSITHYEYLRAIERKLPVMAFLLDENYPWPPQFIDGFDKTRAQAPTNADDIRRLRQELQQERVVSWFTTPSDLEARVSAAVTMAGLTRQLDLQPAAALPPGTGEPNDSSADKEIRDAIIAAADHQRALKINLATTWWSTRLYLVASLAERLTQARRILVINTKPDEKTAPAVAAAAPADPAQPPPERLVGQLSTSAILDTIGPKVEALGKFAKFLHDRPLAYNRVESEIDLLLAGWRGSFGNIQESAVKIDLTAEVLRRWFGDAMLQQPLRITDLQRASVVDLLRLLDYPNDYVPVLTRYTPDADKPATERVDVVDKTALNARLARSYLVELMDRARIV